MSDESYGDALPDGVIQVNTGRDEDPDHVDDFRTKDHYPDEIAAQWDEIRAGRCVYVDEEGHEVEELQDAYKVLHPSYAMAGMPSSLSGIGPGELPPLTSHRVGRPDDEIEDAKDDEWKDVYAEWIHPETENFMVTGLNPEGEVVDMDVNEAYDV